MEIRKLEATLDDENRNRLSARTYDKNWTPIPHQNLPQNVRESVSAIYKGLTKKELSGPTWAVSAQDGHLSRIFGPTIFADKSGDTPSAYLQWNEEKIPVQFSADKGITFPNGEKGNVKAKFSQAKVNGWDAATIAITVTDKKNKIAHVLPMALRVADFENRPDVEALEMMLESEPEHIFEFIGEAPKNTGGPQLEGHVIRTGEVAPGDYEITAVREINSKTTPYLLQTVAVSDFSATYSERQEDGSWKSFPVDIKKGEQFILKPNEALTKLTSSKKISDSESEYEVPFSFTVDEGMKIVSLQGPLIKVAHLPVGDYEITAIKKTRSKWMPHLAQSTAIEDFKAPTGEKQPDGNWIDIEVSLKKGDKFIIRPNKKLAGHLAAGPIVSESEPGILHLQEIGEFNGYPSATIDTTFTKFRVTEGDFNLSF